MAHYYTRDGETAYTVPYADGRPGKDTTIADARKLGLVPSVTEVMKVQDKPGLNHWFSNRMALYGAKNAELLPGMEEYKWLGMVRDQANEKTDEAIDIGTALHDIVEAVVNNSPLPDIDFPVGDPEVFFDSFCEWWGKTGFRVVCTELPFAHPMGFGGRIDLCALDKSDKDVIVDWKSRDTAGKKIQRLVFEDSNPIQLAAYLEGFRHHCFREYGGYVHMPRLANVIISRDEPGRVEMYEWDFTEYGRYWDWFKGLFEVWKCKNRYDPAF